MSFLSFKKTAIGIDIFDQAIEIVLLEKDGSKIKLVNKGRAILTPGLIIQGRVSDKKLLADTLTALFKKNKINVADHKVVVFGLPDNQSYVHSFHAEKVKGDKYDNLVVTELTQIVPIPINELTFGYTIISDKKDGVNIVSVGGDRSVVTDWQNFFSGLGIKKILIAPEKTTTEIGQTVSTKVGLETTKKSPRTVKKAKISETEYIEAIGLAISGLDNEIYKVPFFNDLLSSQEVKETKVIEALSYKDEPEDGGVQIVDGDASDEDNIIRKQKMFLAVIAIFGLVGIGLAYWYQTEQTKQQQAFLASKQTKFSIVQPFTLDVPIATASSEITSDRVNGRLFVDIFNTTAKMDEAVAFSKIRAGQNLLDGEKAWPEPVSIINVNDKTSKKIPSYKYTVTWLTYNGGEVNALAVRKVSNALTSKGINYAVNNVERTTLKKTDNPQVLLMTVTVSISLAKKIDDVIIFQ